ncbi:MAG: hypothetical protein WCP21_22125, partial [Armatimonadota bacterium]
LARYTNLSLLPALLALTWLHLRGRRAVVPCLLLTVAFALVSAPWFYANYRASGSPLATWQYTNIGMSVIPRVTGLNRAQWWWDTQSQYHSIGDLIATTPGGYVRNFLATGRDTVGLIVQQLGPLGAAGLLGALALPWLVDRRRMATLWLCAGAYLALVCQAFVYPPVAVPFVAFMALTTALAAQRLVRLGRPTRRLYRYGGVLPALALLLASNLHVSYGNVTKYLADRSDSGQMVGAASIGEQLQGDPDIQSKYVMAVNPCRAVYANWSAGVPSRYLCLPLYFKSDDPVALVTYRGLSPEVLNWAPRYPFRPMVNRADYLIFDEAAKSFLPQYAYLMDPHTQRVPPNWEVRCREPGVVVWKINW